MIITITVDVILIPLMGDGTFAFPVLMLLTYRLYLQIFINLATISFPVFILLPYRLHLQIIFTDRLTE